VSVELISRCINYPISLKLCIVGNSDTYKSHFFLESYLWKNNWLSSLSADRHRVPNRLIRYTLLNVSHVMNNFTFVLY
jgi:hypothetical protein